MLANNRHTQSCSDLLNSNESPEKNSLIMPNTAGRENGAFQHAEEEENFATDFQDLSEQNNEPGFFSLRENTDRSRQVMSPKFENSSTCSNIHPKSSSDLNEDLTMISSERKVLQDIGNRQVPETLPGLGKPKNAQKSETVEPTTLNKILQQYHDAFSTITNKKISDYDLYKTVDEHIMRILTTNESTGFFDSSRSDKENFNYTDAQAFYSTNTRYLKRAASLKQITKKEEEPKPMVFSEYYQRYMIPMREKIEEYAEKINWLVKEKELEFFNMNEIIQHMIEDFNKERKNFEATLLDNNLLIANLRETLDSCKENNNTGKFKSQGTRTEHIDLPRQIPMKNLKSFAATPEKLYSFRAAASGQGKNRYLNINMKKNGISPAESKIARKIGFEDSSNKMNELNPDLINISQINFETHETDFSMTNPLFNDKPTSRFMDFDDPDSHPHLLHLGNTNKAKPGTFEQQMAKNWAIKEEESFSRQGENSMLSPEFDFVKTMNENLFTKIVQNDNEKTKLLELVDKLICDKKDKKEKKSAAMNDLRVQQMELAREREQLEMEKQELEEAKEQLNKEKEELVKKNDSLKDMIKTIQTKSAKQLAEKDLQLLLMDKKIEAKKKSLEEEWNKINTVKKEVKNAQDMISNEWRKIGNEIKELEKLYSQYEQAKEELANSKKEMKVQYEANMKDIQRGKKELYEAEKKVKLEKRNIQKQEEMLIKRSEELEAIEHELQEKEEVLIREREDFKAERSRREEKFGQIDSKLRAMANRIRKDN